MKKIILFLVFCCFSQNAISQFWIDVSAKAGWGPNILFNKTIFDSGDLEHNAASFGLMYAGKVGFNFGDEHSLNFDFASTRFSQNFTDGMDNDLKEEPSFYSFDIAVLYRKLSLGRYLEIGPVYSRINPNTIDQEYLNENNWGAIFGFGRTLAGSDRFSVNLGLRFRYIFTDVVNEERVTAADYVPENQFLATNLFEGKYEKSTPLSAFVILELDWAVGVFGTSTCYGGRQRLILF